MKIRPIKVEDNSAIAAIIRSVLTEFRANKLGTVYYDITTDNLYNLFKICNNAYYWIAEEEGMLLGGAGIYPTQSLPNGCCELVKLYLLPLARGKGYGKLLIEQCFETAKDKGFNKVYLETMPELHNALSLYEKCGFEYLNAPLGESGHFGCDIWMIKYLL